MAGFQSRRYLELENAMRIFAADDAEDARQMMTATLASGGYDDVHVADSGDALLAMLGIDPLDKAAPEADIILLDVNMPGRDGIETCARIRSDSRYQFTPVLMVSARADISTLSQAFQAGAHDYVNKPFRRVELLARLRSAQRLKSELDRRRAREQELLDAQGQRTVHNHRLNNCFDSTTGLLSRASCEAYVATVQSRDAETFGVIALQIDRLPQLQANYGIQLVTKLLHEATVTLAKSPAQLRDLLAYFEDGVFVTIRHGVNEDRLAEIARELRNGISGISQLQSIGKSFGTLTVSIGVSCNREPRTCLSAAVSAMERAASEGGDRILSS